LIETADEFARLRTSGDAREQWHAGTDQAPLEVWREVVARFPDLKIWVVRNKTVPIEMLQALAGDPDRQVRRDVAAKRKLTTALFELLAGDVDEVVRRQVAINRKVPAHVRARLELDPSEFVRRGATPNLPDAADAPA